MSVTRLNHTGQPAAGGWPVWFSLVTDTYGPMTTGATCGGGGGGHGGWSRTKPFSPFDTPQKSMTSCFAPPPSPEAEGAVGAEAEGLACSYEMSRYCRTAEREGEAKCLACAGANAARLKGRCTQAELNAICNGTHPGPSPSPYPPHHHGRGECDYDQEAGALWNQRLKQYLIANGVAVVVINPYTEDSWDAGPWWWDSGVDKPFLSKVFQMIAAGEMGKLDKDRVVIRGWSGGAQMVSWLMQVIATNKTFGDTMTMRGGVMMSGGSYNCCTRAPPVPPICRPLADHNSLVSCQSLSARNTLCSSSLCRACAQTTIRRTPRTRSPHPSPQAPAKAAPRAARATALATPSAPPATRASRRTASSAARGITRSSTTWTTRASMPSTRRSSWARPRRPTTTQVRAYFTSLLNFF